MRGGPPLETPAILKAILSNARLSVSYFTYTLAKFESLNAIAPSFGSVSSKTAQLSEKVPVQPIELVGLHVGEEVHVGEQRSHAASQLATKHATPTQVNIGQRFGAAARLPQTT